MPPAPLGWCQRAHCSKDTQSIRRQEFLGRGPKSLEQSACFAATAADVNFGQFKRLLKSFLFGEIAAHLWLFVFNAPCISWFTYLLTYLLSARSCMYTVFLYMPKIQQLVKPRWNTQLWAVPCALLIICYSASLKHTLALGLTGAEYFYRPCATTDVCYQLECCLNSKT